MTPAQERQAAYRRLMVERKGGPARTRRSAATATRNVDHRVKRPPVSIECRVRRCTWRATARAWRPARRIRDEHNAKKHRKAAAP